jgi:DNA-binding transcriptional ArsR family regulator
MRNAKNIDPKITREKAEAATSFLKSLANPNRLMIACALIAGERSVGELETALGLRQPSLSQQLADLRENGIVEARREAKQVFYHLADDRAVALLSILHQIFCGEMLDLPPVIRAPPTSVVRSKHTEAAMFARIASGEQSRMRP